MEEEDEVAIASGTTWNVVEGCLERSLGIARENDELETPGPTSRLVLVPPSGESVPCELTVTFQRRLCNVRQIYVLSSARTVEIYSELEQYGESEYVTTVRGELVSFPEDEFSAKGTGDGRRSSSHSSEKLRGEDGASRRVSLASSEESEMKSTEEDDQNHIPVKVDNEKLVGEWKEQLLNLNGPSLGESRDSEEESFQSLSDDVAGKMVEGNITFDEPLDQTDWVECPHSPMKSSALSSDDEVDFNKCGFFLVDSDGGKQAVHLGGSELLTGEEEAAVFKRDAASDSSGRSKNEESLGQGQTVQERSGLPTAPSIEVVKESAVQSDNVSDLRDVPDAESPRKLSEISHHSDLQALGKACFTDFGNSTGETKEVFLFQIPMYEAEVNLASSDFWRSVKIRLLSLEDKSKLELHKVIVTIVPGPPISTTSKIFGPSGSFQQGAGSSSLLAMFAPGIFQMARGLAESRKVNSLRLMSGDRKLPDPKVSPSTDSTNASLSVLGAELSSQQLRASGTASSSLTGSVSQKKYDSCVGEKEAAAAVSSNSVRKSLEEESCRTGMGSMKDSCFPVVHNGESAVEFDLSDVIESSETKNRQHEKVKESDHFKDDDRDQEVVQRLDRLEAICLRMENSLNFTLENMDRRLKLLEAGGVGRIPVTGQPFWGAGYESGPFVSAASVNLPPVQTGLRTGPPLDKQAHGCTSAPVDSHAGQLSSKGVASRIAPFYPGLLSSTSPSLLSSVSPALPLWPLSSPKHLSPESNSRASSTTTSTLSKDSYVHQLNGSCHGLDAPINAEETFWETQTSDDSGSEMSSDSEHTSYADNSEDPGPSSCPESVSSSPAKPAELVENALASALSAFSASFDAAVVNEKESFPREEEDTAEEDSFTSEEHAPLVDVDCFSHLVVDATKHSKAEEVFMQGYEAIPISVEKELGDLNVGELSQEDVFWASDVGGHEKSSQIDWQDRMLQTQEENVYFPRKVSADAVGKSPKTSHASPDPLDTSNVLCMDDLTTYDLFPTDFERILREDARTESIGAERSEAGFQTMKHDMLPNPFLQELSFEGDGDVTAAEASWLEEWNEKQLASGDNVTVTYMTVRGFTKPLDPLKEMLLQEEMFPEDWNWFTSEVPPSPSVRDIPDPLSGNGSFIPEVTSATFVHLKGEDDAPDKSTGYIERLSLLDTDEPTVAAKFHADVCYEDWVGQKTQWSLLDEDPPVASSEEIKSEEGRSDDWFRQRGQRSLLDEDMYIPSRNISIGEREGSIMSPCISPEELYDLSGVIRPPKCTDAERSPSSHTSRSNPFEDDCNDRLGLKQENQNPPLRDLLEDFGEEVHEFEAPESERTQSLLFHLSL
ncbi:hypothetical protein Mapa_014735 [Marchantia paleacea]|nr:hypothetical protein Mapa_014735 [Marchantia paleacea]